MEDQSTEPSGLVGMPCSKSSARKHWRCESERAQPRGEQSEGCEGLGDEKLKATHVES
jgi:hypothetical protein